jgi:hypothetical protein
MFMVASVTISGIFYILAGVLNEFGSDVWFGSDVRFGSDVWFGSPETEMKR